MVFTPEVIAGCILRDRKTDVSLIGAVILANVETLDLADDRYRRFCAAVTFELSSHDTPAHPTQYAEFHDYVRGIIHISKGREQQYEGVLDVNGRSAEMYLR